MFRLVNNFIDLLEQEEDDDIAMAATAIASGDQCSSPGHSSVSSHTTATAVATDDAGGDADDASPAGETMADEQQFAS